MYFTWKAFCLFNVFGMFWKCRRHKNPVECILSVDYKWKVFYPLNTLGPETIEFYSILFIKILWIVFCLWKVYHLWSIFGGSCNYRRPLQSILFIKYPWIILSVGYMWEISQLNTCRRYSIHKRPVDCILYVDYLWKVFYLWSIFGWSWNWPVEGILFIKYMWIVSCLWFSCGRSSICDISLGDSANEHLWKVFYLYSIQETSLNGHNLKQTWGKSSVSKKTCKRSYIYLAPLEDLLSE